MTVSIQSEFPASASVTVSIQSEFPATVSVTVPIQSELYPVDFYIFATVSQLVAVARSNLPISVQFVSVDFDTVSLLPESVGG